MKMHQSLLVLVSLVVVTTHSLPHSNTLHLDSPCHDTVCKAGRECVVDGGRAECMCVTSCPDHDKPVCGDDGLSYDNYCLLHQRACITGKHIAVDYRGYCKADIAEAMREFGVSPSTTSMPLVFSNPTTRAPPTTFTPKESTHEQLSVCYGPQRDALRDSAISTWHRDITLMHWYTPGMTYMQSLSGHFRECDSDADRQVRPDELLKCLSGVSFRQRPEQDYLVTKTLCIDAMMEEVDSNKDWKLDQEEFRQLFNPMAHLITKNCSLEGRSYSDGAEVTVTCNHCVCATGSWVCATHECDKKPEDSDQSHTGSKHVTETNNSKDIFGYMDTKYDLEENKISTHEDYDYGDDYYDEALDSYREEEAKKEFALLSDHDKKTVTHLENKIRNFYQSTHHSGDSTTEGTTTTTTQMRGDEDLLAREDHIVEQYDNLLQQSKLIREKLQNLRHSLSDLEREKQERENKQTVDHHHAAINEVDHTLDKPVDLGPRDYATARLNRKYKKYEAYRQERLALQEHNRRVSQIDNDIWEDQWKAKIGRHDHRQISNHL